MTTNQNNNKTNEKCKNCPCEKWRSCPYVSAKVYTKDSVWHIGGMKFGKLGEKQEKCEHINNCKKMQEYALKMLKTYKDAVVCIETDKGDIYISSKFQLGNLGENKNFS